MKKPNKEKSMIKPGDKVVWSGNYATYRLIAFYTNMEGETCKELAIIDGPEKARRIVKTSELLPFEAV